MAFKHGLSPRYLTWDFIGSIIFVNFSFFFFFFIFSSGISLFIPCSSSLHWYQSHSNKTCTSTLFFLPKLALPPFCFFHFFSLSFLILILKKSKENIQSSSLNLNLLGPLHWWLVAQTFSPPHCLPWLIVVKKSCWLVSASACHLLTV